MNGNEHAAQFEKLLTRAEVASILRVTPRAVNKWARQGSLRPVRLPARKTALGYLASDISNILTRKA